MFTGIVEEVGRIKAIRRGNGGAVLEIEAVKVLEGTRVGDSIATNGVCLTVTGMGAGSFDADVMPETLRRSNLGDLRPGDRVNLERALRLDSRLGGHLVAGHVDGTGVVSDRRQEDNAVWFTMAAAPEILRYVIEKGSIAVDGVSLTVAYVDEAVFKVSVIPHTQEETTLLGKRVGAVVNLENDLIAKYVEKFTGGGERKQGLSLEFLQANGF